MKLIFFCAVLISIGYISILEYTAHRWLMHFPGLGKNSWWSEHAIEHHGHARNDVNITLSAGIMVIGCLPLFGFSAMFGWSWTAFVLAECIAYAAIWSALHAAHHEVGSFGTILRRSNLYARWQRHHALHHERPSRNFGTVFIWTDRIFGTKAK